MTIKKSKDGVYVVIFMILVAVCANGIVNSCSEMTVRDDKKAKCIRTWLRENPDILEKVEYCQAHATSSYMCRATIAINRGVCQ